MSNILSRITCVRLTVAGLFACCVLLTNADSMAQSDARTDRLADVAERFLDLSVMRIGEDKGRTQLVHELLGRVTLSDFERFDTLQYWTFLDSDDNLDTGGTPGDLGVEAEFSGAELVTRVEIRPGPLNEFLSVVPTVWRFSGGRFVVVADSTIRAFISPLTGVVDRTDGSDRLYGSDHVVIDMPTATRGSLTVPFRMQALTRGVQAVKPVVLDRLEEEGQGRSFRLRSQQQN